ncbi:MAG: GPP34 family phosphoprotein [Planctomycetota bacterium]
MDRDVELSLPEQLMLLVLRDDTGTMESSANMYQLALGGAILSELLLAGTITIDDDKKKLVRFARQKRLRDPILNECLVLVSESKRSYNAATWVSRFGGLKRLRHRIAEGLCRRGILEDSEDKVLFFFTRAIYPTINPAPERQLVTRMREAIQGSSRDLDPSVALLIALAQATGLLRIHFDKSELKERKDRIEQITSGDLVGSATADAVRAAQQAAQAAVMSAIIASTVINTTTHC